MPPNSTNHSGHNYSTDDTSSQLIEVIPYYDDEVSHSALFDGAFQVVKKIFPSWAFEDIDFYQCKDGITNQLVKVTYKLTDFSVLVRAYGKGSELIIDREQEVTNIITLSAQNMCPPLYARFKNGLVYGYVKGKVATVEDLRQEATAELIAKKLSKWHKVKLDSEQPTKAKEQKLWQTMYNWLKQVPKKYENEKTQSTFETRFDKKKLEDELKYLIEKLEQLKSPIVFSHNDLLFGNIIFNQEKDEAHFIDYEYGCYAFRGFDIGNHFNEFAGFECEYSRYPTKCFQMKWFEWYLTESNNGVKPTIEEKENLYIESNGFSLASHFYWGLWAMIQAKISNIDFDYMSYAVLRFDEYDKRKEEILSLF